MRPPRLLAAGGLLALMGLAPAPATAVVHTVDRCDGHPDGADAPAGGLAGQLRRLVNDAAPGDLILIPAGCTITLAGARGDDLNQTGDLDLTRPLTIQGAGPGRSVIDGGGNDRVIHVLAPAAVDLSGLTIRNGHHHGADNKGGSGLLVESGASLALRDAVVSGNVSPGDGAAAVENLGGTALLEQATITGNANFGGSGGGFQSLGGTATLRNVTISGNHADFSGGGVHLAGSTVTLQHVTVAGNDAGSQGGGLDYGDATVTLRNTLLAGNIGGPGATPDDCTGLMAGTLVSLGSNLVQAPIVCAGLLPSDLTGVEPLLGPLALNGGSTPTHGLLAGSPALDAGDGGCAPVDQRGVLRPQGSRCDIGAFEAGAGASGAFPDFDGDGRADLVVATGPGGDGEIRVFAGATGSILLAVTPFGPAFRGALGVAACDLTGDGVPDLLAAGAGPSGPEVRGLDGRTGTPLPPPLDALVPFAPSPGGSGRTAALGVPAVACADVDGDGTPDVITGAPAGAPEGPRVRVFSGRDGTLLRDDHPFDAGPGAVAVGP